jgi:hypothetical protein
MFKQGSVALRWLKVWARLLATGMSGEKGPEATIELAGLLNTAC